jgi:hypothetical protein
MIQQIFKLSGRYADYTVLLDGKELTPLASQTVINHSPDGFNWGYSGSGPSQLALAICLKLLGKDMAVNCYQDFKNKLIARLPKADFSVNFLIIDGDWHNPMLSLNAGKAVKGA